MTPFAESYAAWLADYYALATVLLALASVAATLLKQPAQRLMVTKSTFVALVLLAILSAVPGWSVIHLLATERPVTPADSLPEAPMPVSENITQPFLDQSNIAQQAEHPVPPPPTADESLPKPITPKMSWPALLATAHLAGMAGIVAWLAVGWMASLRLRQTAKAAPTNVAAILHELATVDGPQSNAWQLFTHDRLDVAVALGVLRPIILLPECWTTSQSHDRLRAVLAHESTHILNHDLRWVAAARTLLIALWANPLFWFVKRRLRLDQEALADAAAAEISSRQQYAEQLVAWARDARNRPALHLSSAVGLWEGPSQLRQRIAILLDEQLTVLRNCSRRWRIAASLLAIFAATTLSMVTLQPPQRAEANTPISPEPNLGTLAESFEKLTDILGIPYQQPTEGTQKRASAVPASAWGKPVNGLRAALVIESPPVDSFNQLNHFVVVENVSDHDIRFSVSIHSVLGFNSIEIIGADGKPLPHQPATITTMYADPPRLGRFLLKPNERIPIAPLSAQLVRLDENGQPVDPPRDFSTESFKAKSGQYSVTATADFGPSMESVNPVTKIRTVLSPKPGEWTGKLQTASVQVALFENEKSNDRSSQPIVANPRSDNDKSAAKPTTDPVFELYRKHFKGPRSNVIEGIVVDEKLQPVAQAQVSLYRYDLRDSTQKLITEKVTDAEGKVRFDKVLVLAKEFPSGKLPPFADIGDELVQVTVRAPGRVTHSHLQARQMIAMRGEPIMVMMPPAATLRGRVTGPDGKPVADALVSVAAGGFSPSAIGMSARTNADGTYVINDVPSFDLKSREKEEEEAIRNAKKAARNVFRASPPFLTLKVVHPDFAVAQGQVEKTPGTMDVQLQPAADLVGHVVFADSGKPASGARVLLAGHDQRITGIKPTDEEQRRFVPPFYTASVRADANGNYRLASLPTGFYHLTADLPGWVNVGLRDIEATPGKTNTAPDLTLTKGGTVAIRLIDAKTREPIQLPPEAEALIGNNERPIYDRPPTQRMVPPSKSGLFELQLPAGNHEIYIGGVYVGQETKWMTDYSTPAESPNALVTVTDSNMVQIDMPVVDSKHAKVVEADIVEVKPPVTPSARPNTKKKQDDTSNDKSKQMSMPRLQPNVASGRVVDEKRQPLTGAEVLLFRTNQRDGTRKLVAKKVTDATGQFRFDNVIDIDKEFPGRKFPGSYEATDEMLVEVVRAPGRITNVPLLMPQEIAKTGDYHEVKMLPAATLRGRVTDASGKPVAGALVAMDDGPNVPWEEVQASRSDADGNYTIDDGAPFDEAIFKNQVAEDERRAKEAEASGTPTFRLFRRHPILRVDHPEYAVKRSTIDQSPGTKDVQLEPASVLDGRVVFADSGKPAPGVLVGIVTSVERHDPPVAPPLTEQHKLLVRTDADGKYHAGSLPQGTYELWAETPGWVNVGTNDVAAESGKTSAVPDLTLTKGGTVRARVVDAKSREPIPLPKDARAMIAVRPVGERPSLRRIDAPFIGVNSQARFELQLTPGKKQVAAVGVEVDGNMKYSGQTAAKVTVVDGETVEVDLPVTEMKEEMASGPVDQAESLRRQGKPLEAIKLLDAAIEKDPQNIDAVVARADAWHTAGDDRKATADYEQALKLKPSPVRKMIAWNNLAFILAASPDDRVRDGKRAVDMAETAKLLQPAPTPDVLDTLAAAYAEAGQFDRAVKTQQEAIQIAPDNQREEFRKYLKLYEDHNPRRETRTTNEQPKDTKEGASTSTPNADQKFAQKRLDNSSAAPVKFQLVQNTTPATVKTEVKRPPGILGYGDDKPDGKKSIGGSGEMIEFELPKGVTKIKGIRIHGSRYGPPQAPKEDFEITFLSENRDETLHSEAGPYRLFNRGKEQWVRVAFKNDVELPRKFWVCLNFNAAATKGVYVSYDTSTKGKHSRVGLPGDKEEPKETDFKGDWMVQLILPKPEK